MKPFIGTCALLFVLLLNAATVLSQPYKRVAVIGSSTAYGYFPSPSPAYPQDSGWVAKLQKYYQQLNIVDTIFNLGCLGRDCYAGMPTGYPPPAGESYPDENSNITKAINMIPKPDVIIINYPSNNYERLDNDSIIQCFRTMKDEANANGIRCYIATTQPRNSFDSAGKQKLKDLRDLLNTTFGIWSIDFFTPITEEPSLNILPDYALGDNIHINPAGHTLLLNQVIIKSIFTVVLPIHLKYFTASRNGDKTLLRWATSSENNNSRFLIERSNDSKNFDLIATVNAGNNNNTLQKYSYPDATTNSKGFFYRIIAISSSANRQTSAIVFVAPANKTFLVGRIFPSPSATVIHTQIAVAGKQAIDVLVTDASGKQIVHQNIQASTLLQYQLDISKFSKGNYFIRFSSNGQAETLSFSRQ